MNTLLSEKAVGDIVKLNVGGTPYEFLIVHQGLPSDMYDESCNGTWLLIKDGYEIHQWNSSNVNDYENSTSHRHLNSTILDLFDVDIQPHIKQVKIPYRPGSGTSETVKSGANGLPVKIFSLSDSEVGLTKANTDQHICVDGAKLTYFEYGVGTSARNKRIAYNNGNAISWWTRSPYLAGSTDAWGIGPAGSGFHSLCAQKIYMARPALIFPSTLSIDEDGFVVVDNNIVYTGAPNLTFSVSGNKVSSVSGMDFVTVTFSSDIAYTSFECRATKVGEDYGVGKGQLIASFSATPANTERTFEIYNEHLLHGDGDYRISLFATGEDGNVNDNYPYVPVGSSKYITSDGKVYLCRR